jgi:adenylate kinase family enzyme
MYDMKLSAILLLGPTGSGKTPLGCLLEQNGLAGHRCIHFDFGENLRAVIGGSEFRDVVSPQDVDYLRDVLDRGDLLEDKDFPLAERILRGFLAQRNVDANSVVILNGLPRHVGQAADMTGLLSVESVVYLECSPECVVQRIQLDAGGDRGGRVDDDLPAVTRKLSIFRERTAPLIQFYRHRRAHVFRIHVTHEMTAEAMRALIAKDYSRRNKA